MSGDFDLLSRGCVDVINSEDLQRQLRAGKKLKVKVGFDPTAPDLHLGHAVLLNKMRQFQDLGHEVVFLIGDFTGLIGDPTGKNVTRKALSHQQIRANAQTYASQVFKILDPQTTTIAFNSTWMNNCIPSDFIKLTAKYTLARMLERDDFAKRYAEHSPIAMHELLYPLVQAYDSVQLRADVELGGTDQTFNLLVGRDIQREYQQPPQVVMTLPLLEGLDGVQKMSKSLDNYVAFYDEPQDMFGKLMSVSDKMMWRYFELLSALSNADIERLKRSVAAGQNPRDVKLQMAREQVSRFHGVEAGQAAEQAFIAQFSQGELPADMPTLRCAEQDDLRLSSLLIAAGLCASQSEARRLIQQKAVKLGDELVSDSNYTLQLPVDLVVRVGKRRYARLC